MFSLATLALTAAYMAMLFAIAWWYERKPAKGSGPRLPRQGLYALSLAIYCSSWTYYGAVGTAARSGWEYLPVYLGPVLGLTLMFPLWQRIAFTARKAHVGSLADFISSRYGKSPVLGASVALVAIVGSLPYVALQLKSISMAGELINAGSFVAGSETITVLVVAAVLAGFAILFGARRPDLTEHNRGLIQAIGVESIVKLAALMLVAGFALYILLSHPNAPSAAAYGLDQFRFWPPDAPRFWAIVLVSTLAVFCLPRQFHVGFVEGGAPAEIRRARWIFPLYLGLTSLAVLPLVAAGKLLLPGINPDLFVLALPLTQGHSLLTAIVFVGGFSAATAMVIIEAVALSAMVSNNLVLPLIAGLRGKRPTEPGNVSSTILNVRRGAIIALLFMAWLYYQAMDQSHGLAAIGLVSFTALAQLAPSLFGAVLWRGGTARGALAGLGAGMLVWLLLLALPQLAPDLQMHLPQTLGIEDPFAAGVFASLGLNLCVFIIVSRASTPLIVDRVQARLFVDHIDPEWAERRGSLTGATVHDLRHLVGRFIGEDRASNAFKAWASESNIRLRDNDKADANLARAAERMLAGAVGAVSARRVISAALSSGGSAPEDVLRMMDEASQAVQFNRELLLTTLDNIDQGVSVVDEGQHLVAWNQPYVDMFDLPPGFLHVGMPISSVYRFNAERDFPDKDAKWIDRWINRRLEALASRVHHKIERERPDGRIFMVVGEPITGDAYVTSYTDITDLRRTAQQLRDINEQLEARVAERTEEAVAARHQAERATASKTRFLAAASHDLLQPLHAARLFIAALREDPHIAHTDARNLAVNADRSIESAHRLLTALLNLSKLEGGGVQPAVAPLPLGRLFEDIAREFTPLANAKGLELRVKPTTLWVSSDRDLLRSMLQNLVANAIRYTDDGRVVVGARRKAGRVDIHVLDTGRGIPESDRSAIFGEFVRLPGAPVDGPAAGLGLAIVQRLSHLLDHPLGLSSQLGAGSDFRIEAPRVAAPPQSQAMRPKGAATRLNGLRILCVDNEEAILGALEVLLKRWGAIPFTATSLEQVEALDADIDAAVVDLHLGDAKPDGFAVIACLRERGIERIALVTADTRDSLENLATEAGATLLRKPVKPASLKAFLSGG